MSSPVLGPPIRRRLLPHASGHYTTLDVDPARDQLKMHGVDAGPIAAGVINLQPVGDWPPEPAVGDSVGLIAAPATVGPNMEVSISASECALPGPAPVVPFGDLIPESLPVVEALGPLTGDRLGG